MPARKATQTAGRTTEQGILAKRPSALIAGLDEAGRGPLAGPVSIGLVVFAPEFFTSPVPDGLIGLTDSKKLSESRRLGLLCAIRQEALFATSVLVPAKIIDARNINGAIEFAIHRALRRAEQASIEITHALIDGNYRFSDLYEAFPRIDFSSIKQGDSKVFTIAAASILAKTRRDHRLERYDAMFPDYGLARHKGYGTAAHRKAIQELGPSPIHRRSYKW